MKFRCPYCKRDLGLNPAALCPHCGKGFHIPDHLRPLTFRERKRGRKKRALEAGPESRRRRFPAPASPFGRRPLSILLTIGVLTMAGLLLLGGVKHRPAYARRTPRDITQEELNIFRAALEEFRADCGRYPDTRSGLMALINNPGLAAWKGPYVTVVKPDSWRRRHVYELNEDKPLLLSLGPDGRRGTADDLQPRQWEALTQNAAIATVGSTTDASSVSVRIR